MSTYTVHEPPRGTNRLDRAARMAFVRDGFSWGAFLVPVIWLIWRRMWWILAVYLAAALVLTLLLDWWAPNEAVQVVIGLGFALLFAFEANALRRWSLRRQNWRQAGIAVGAGRDGAERDFFARWLVPAADPRMQSPAPVLGSMPSAA